jgi:hypothetical protein
VRGLLHECLLSLMSGVCVPSRGRWPTTGTSTHRWLGAQGSRLQRQRAPNSVLRRAPVEVWISERDVCLPRVVEESGRQRVRVEVAGSECSMIKSASRVEYWLWRACEIMWMSFLLGEFEECEAAASCGLKVLMRCSGRRERLAGVSSMAVCSRR